MKGLFLNNFYEAWNNLKVIGIVILLVGIGVAYLRNYTALELFPYITISMFAVSSISTLRKDTVSKWDKYELTLPVKRRDLITSKYTSYLFWASTGAMLSIIIIIVAFLIHGNLFAYGIRDGASLISLGMGLAIMAGAVFYPLAIIFGAEKSEILITVSGILSVGSAILILTIINNNAFITLSYGVRLIIFNATYIIMYILSFFLSNKLFTKKEI